MLRYLKNLGLLLAGGASIVGLGYLAICLDKVLGHYWGLGTVLTLLLLAGAGWLTYVDSTLRSE